MAYLTGFHAIEERIKSGRACGPLLLAKAGPRARELVTLAAHGKIRVDRVGTFELDRLAPDNRGIALYAEELAESGADISLEEFLAGLGGVGEAGAVETRAGAPETRAGGRDRKGGKRRQDLLVVILDEITDPHNYGAILRSCDQFGVDLVISGKHRNAKHAEVISKTSAGAVSWVPQAETANLARAVEDLKKAGFWVYGADMEGEPIYKKDLRGRTALILGGEGTGIPRLLRERCDGMVGIPSEGRIDSLNVSVAAGVLFYEVQRQRGQ
ncbi:MAG: 23S rRNA (guanosine(2251)-2'-O)-methyltransferase RlmB [Treponema sp.]|jgi:23S rRNA (guanosine2251-2'-O)-methyltransferase|nr:23S rRNA (guanosine(2251)-2'-O)-methyltransferase RlmB [Treponema sp.]